MAVPSNSTVNLFNDGLQGEPSEINFFSTRKVLAMVYALKVCYSITEDEHYGRLMYRAFNWFLGGNSLEAVVYDRTTGGCYDGVGKKTINLNQGAESTISYLLAWLNF